MGEELGRESTGRVSEGRDGRERGTCWRVRWIGVVRMRSGGSWAEVDGEVGGGGESEKGGTVWCTWK